MINRFQLMLPAPGAACHSISSASQADPGSRHGRSHTHAHASRPIHPWIHPRRVLWNALWNACYGRVLWNARDRECTSLASGAITPRGGAGAAACHPGHDEPLRAQQMRDRGGESHMRILLIRIFILCIIIYHSNITNNIQRVLVVAAGSRDGVCRRCGALLRQCCEHAVVLKCLCD